jgi:hypothetical protein
LSKNQIKVFVSLDVIYDEIERTHPVTWSHRMSKPFVCSMNHRTAKRTAGLGPKYAQNKLKMQSGVCSIKNYISNGQYNSSDDLNSGLKSSSDE